MRRGGSGAGLAEPRKPRKTPTFVAQQQNIRARSARNDKAASVLTKLCAYHLPSPLRRWRLIYKYVVGQGPPELILIGEHWKSVARGAGSSAPSSLGTRLHFDDVYDAVATFHAGDSPEERKRLRRALKTQEKERCC